MTKNLLLTLMLASFCNFTHAQDSDKPQPQEVPAASPKEPIDSTGQAAQKVDVSAPESKLPSPKELIAAPATKIDPSKVQKLEIKQLLLEKNRAVISADDTITIGKDLVATFKNGTQCTLKVTMVKAPIANVDTSDCKSASELTINQKLEVSLALEEPETTSQQKQQLQSASPAPEEPSKKDPSDVDVQKMWDLQYLTPQGAFALTLIYSFSSSNQKVSIKDTGDEFYSVDRKIAGLEGDLSYGVTDFMSVDVAYSQVNSDKETDSFGPGSTVNGQVFEFNSSGPQDPGIGATFRLLKQELRSVNLDLAVSYSPKTVGHVDPSATANGNETKVGDAGLVVLSVGQRFHKFSYAGTMSVRAVGGGNSTNASSGKTTGYSSYSETTAAASGQFQPNKQIALRASISSTAVSSQTITSKGSPDVTQDAYGQGKVGAAFIFSPVNNIFLALYANRETAPSQSGKSGTVDLTGSQSGSEVGLVFGAEL